MIRRAAFVGLLLAAACGRYDEFRLPPAGDGSVAGEMEWEIMSEPVLGRGQPGMWDAVDVLNPSVVVRNGLYFNFYSGYDGETWHTGLATSEDGIRWEKQGKVLSPDPDTWEGDYIAANGGALNVADEFLYWYQAGQPPQIGLARSPDGREWSKHRRPVLETGPRGSWDERGVADPYVIHRDGRFYLFYLGQDRARRQRLGVAVSDDGVAWSKLRTNPVLELGAAGAFDETGLGEPAVWAWGGKWWMLYTARDRAEYRRLGLAVSEDGVRWSRFSESAVVEGHDAWNSKVVCDATVEVAGDEVRIWFGGGDEARPDENLNGQIGYASLRWKGDKLGE